MHLLRIVDGEEKQPLGFVYGGLKDAIKEVKEAFRNNENIFKPYVEAIIQGMKGRLDGEIHKAAYYLNPYYFYRDFEEIKIDPSVMDAITNCVARFYPDPKIQDIIMTVELRNFQTATGHFGKPQAKRQRENNDKHFNPAHWWSLYGSEAPYLQAMAIKILGLACSASGCERNWSSFEWTHSKKRGKMEVQQLNDIVFVQFNARINDRKILRKFDPLCAREEAHDENVREWTSGRALDLPEEICASSSSVSSTSRNIEEDDFDSDESVDDRNNRDDVDFDLVGNEELIL